MCGRARSVIPAPRSSQAVKAAAEACDLIVLSLLYGDLEGGQRMISQFSLRYQPGPGAGHPGRWLASAARHFSVDRPDPR